MVALLVLAALPFGWFKGTLERRLSARIGRPVTIATLDRREWLSFTPTLDVRGLRIPQPAWAGPGDLAVIDAAAVTLPVWPLLIGRIRPHAVTIARGRIALIRTADGRSNWLGGDGGGGGATPLTGLRIGALRVGYRDAKRNRSADVMIASDARGLRIAGTGRVRGAPVRIAAGGPAIAAGAGRAWPFTARITGDRLNLVAAGTMARPLDAGHMRFHASASADDLRRIDAVIEAGLFGTDDLALTAEVERAPDRWIVRRLAGTIGQSRLTGRVTVVESDGRNRIDGAVAFDRLDFADLSSDEGNAQGAALERRIGLRLIPNTRLDLRRIDRTDARVAFTVRHIVSEAGPTALAWAKGVATLDHRLLKIAPVTLGFDRGRIAGRVVVDQRGGPLLPTMHFDLRISDTTLATLVAGAGAEGIDAPVAGRVRLTGRGRTIRQAIGQADGRIALVARAGVLPARIAAGLGFDVGRVLTSGGEQAQLRCGVLGLQLRHGVGRAAPLLIDTTKSLARGGGTIRFPDETLALTLTGAPKRDSLLRLDGAILVGGTIRDPRAAIPPRVKSAGNVLRMIGRAITGKQGPVAADLDCGAEIGRVLG